MLQRSGAPRKQTAVERGPAAETLELERRRSDGRSFIDPAGNLPTGILINTQPDSTLPRHAPRGTGPHFEQTGDTNMLGYTKIQIMGNLGGTPEMKFLPSGDPVHGELLNSCGDWCLIQPST